MTPPTPSNPLRELRVLVVDDSHAMRAYVIEILGNLGVGVVLQADNGSRALELLAEASPPVNVIISDLAMPDMDGVELLRNVAARDPVPDIITISSLDARLRFTVAAMIQQRGMNLLASLGKPFSPAQLEAALQAHFNEIDASIEAVSEGDTVEIADDVLSRALAGNRIVVHYQPQVRIADGSIAGMEALVRLEDPERGLIYPDAFLETAEANGKLSELSQAVFEQATAQIGRWSRQGHPMAVSINIAGSLINNLDLPDAIGVLARAQGLETNQITIEITETALDSGADVLDVVSRFRMRGFGVSIDDFGTGASGLSRLRELPFTELKIDKSFVTGAHGNPELRAILENSIQLGHQLNMVVVAEGVETVEDWDLLNALDCDIAQGYLVGRPMSSSKFPGWAKQWTRLIATKPNESGNNGWTEADRTGIAARVSGSSPAGTQ